MNKTEVYVAQVLSSAVVDNHFLSYVVSYEGLQKEPGVASPIFNFGYNSYRYPNETRVLVLVVNSNFSKPFIVGSVYNQKVVPTVNLSPPREGEVSFNNGTSSNSYLSGLGTSTLLSLGNKYSQLQVAPEYLRFNFLNGSSLFNFEKSNFSVVCENGFSFSQREQKTTLVTKRGFNVFSTAGKIYLEGSSLTFVQKTESLNSEKESTPRPAFEIENGYHNLKGIVGFYEYGGSLTFKVGTGKAVGADSSVAWNVTEGDYNVNLSSGSYNLNCLDPTSAEFNVKVGPNTLPLTTFLMSTTKLKVEIGPVKPSSLTLDTTEFKVEAGVGSPDTLSLGKAAFSVKAGSALLGTSNEVNFSVLSGISLKASKSFGLSKGTIKLDGNVVITGELIVEKEIYGADEVYAQTVVVLGEPVTTTAVALSTHKHPSSTPGAPTKPLPG